MSIFVAKCPHCKVANVSLEVQSGSIPRAMPDRREGSILGAHLQCTNCDLPICATFGPGIPDLYIPSYFASAANRALSESRDITVHGFRLQNMWPEPSKPRIPDHLDPNAARALLQAERNFEVSGNEEAAATMYRRTLEVALKAEFPGGPDNLSKLIKKLVVDGKLTQTIGEWANHIREIGNEAVHEEGPLSRSDLIAMREFTDAVLRYAISLPKEIELRRAATAPPADAGPPAAPPV